MSDIRDGILASLFPVALILLAHFTLHQPDPPLIHAYPLTLYWVITGIIVHTSRWPASIFWRAIVWSMLIGWVVASWGTYWEKNVYVSLGIPQLVGGFAMAFVSRRLERRARKGGSR